MSVAASIDRNAFDVSVETQCDTEEWDQFVRTHAEGRFFHLAGWGETAKRAYGYDTYYITVRRGGALTGALALTDARTPLLGRSLVSIAFSVGGGPLANDKSTLACLLDAASKLGAEMNVQYIECRAAFDAENWPAKTGAHASFETPLITDEGKALEAVPRKRRAEVRKSIDSALAGELSIRHDGKVGEFYKLYAESVRRLGTPVFPKRFIIELLSSFAADSEISVVEYRGQPVAALVSFYFNGTVLPYYVGANAIAREARAFDYLYWSIMRRAVEKGCRRFDFGRSKVDSGAYQYKKLWGIAPRPVQYQVRLITANFVPDVSAANPKFSIFSKAWPKLPAFAANRLGPLLAPNFP